MKVNFEREQGPAVIKAQALALCGLTVAPTNMEIFFDNALSAVLSICGRNDLTEQMEVPTASILAVLLKDGIGRPVSAIKRGDVSITYFSPAYTQARTLLAPFIRLGSVR